MNYLISETTKDERKLIVEKALVISLSGAEYPSDYAISLANDYIEGKKELAEIEELIIKKYKKEEE